MYLVRAAGVSLSGTTHYMGVVVCVVAALSAIDLVCIARCKRVCRLCRRMAAGTDSMFVNVVCFHHVHRCVNVAVTCLVSYLTDVILEV